MAHYKVDLKEGVVIKGNLDFTPVLTAMIEKLEDNSVLEFETGAYHFWPDQAIPRQLYISNTDSRQFPSKLIGLVINGKKGLRLIGQKTRFVFHGNMGALAILESVDITIEDIQIEYFCPSVIDLPITCVTTTENQSQVEVELPSAYHCQVIDNQVHWSSELSPYTGKPYWQGLNDLELSQHLSASTLSVQRTDQGLFFDYQRVSQKDNRLLITYRGKRSIQVGDVFEMRKTKREVVGVFIENATRIAFDKIWFSYFYGMGVISQTSDTLSFNHCLFKATTGRYSASAADMLHFSGCRGAIRIMNCQFHNPHDDMINVHGTFLAVKEIVAEELLASYQHHQTLGFNSFKVGDSIQLFDSQSLLPVSAPYQVMATEPISATNLTDYRLVLDREIAETGHQNLLIDNVTASPDVLIKECHFYQCPTRGILVSSRGKIRIQDNFFEKIKMACIFISCDGNDWFESGPVEDVIIAGNTFKECDSYAVLVEPTNLLLDAKKVHQNILIKDNQLIAMPTPLFSFKSTAQVRIFNNQKESGKSPSVTEIESIDSLISYV